LQIAVLDPTLRSRELARRAICRLGHAPVILTSLSELEGLGKRAEGVGMLLLACPRDPTVFQSLIAQAREILGHEVPLILSICKSQFRVMSVLHTDAISTVVRAPSSFQDAYHLLEAALLRRRVPIAERVIEWRGYRFILDQGVAELAGVSIKLPPREFDLAVAFFRNVNRLLTREWLCTSAWGERETISASRMVDVSVSGLRRKLGLHARLQSIWGQGYQLSEMNESIDTSVYPTLFEPSRE